MNRSYTLTTDDRPTAVYRIVGEGGTDLYVGCSIRPEARMVEHARRFGDEIVTWGCTWFTNRLDAETAERRLIRTLDPKFNKMHGPAYIRPDKGMPRNVWNRIKEQMP